LFCNAVIVYKSWGNRQSKKFFGCRSLKPLHL
jgi:hypothetical protein